MNTKYLWQLSPRKGMPTRVRALSNTPPLTWGYKIFSTIGEGFQSLGGNERGGETYEMELSLYHQSRTGTLKQIFGSFEKDPAKLCLTLGQIQSIAEDNERWFKGLSHPVFFLFAWGGEYYVADIAATVTGAPSLVINVFALDDPTEWPWRIGAMIIIPKQ